MKIKGFPFFYAPDDGGTVNGTANVIPIHSEPQGEAAVAPAVDPVAPAPQTELPVIAPPASQSAEDLTDYMTRIYDTSSSMEEAFKRVMSDPHIPDVDKQELRKITGDFAGVELNSSNQPTETVHPQVTQPAPQALDDQGDDGFEQLFMQKARAFLNISDSVDTADNQPSPRHEPPIDFNRIAMEQGPEAVLRIAQALSQGKTVESVQPASPVAPVAPAQDKTQLVARKAVEVANDQGWSFGDQVSAFMDDGKRVNVTPEILFSYALRGTPIVFKPEGLTPEESQAHDLRVQQYVRNARLANNVAAPQVELEILRTEQESNRAKMEERRGAQAKFDRMVTAFQSCDAFSKQVDPDVNAKMVAWIKSHPENRKSFVNEFVQPEVDRVVSAAADNGQQLTEQHLQIAGMNAFRQFYTRNRSFFGNAMKKNLDSFTTPAPNIVQREAVSPPPDTQVTQKMPEPLRLPVPSPPPSPMVMPSDGQKKAPSNHFEHLQFIEQQTQAAKDYFASLTK